MIVELSIENFAIAEKLHINFTRGFNVLTGETGAGKSIIIDAISLILGSRASRGLIRTGFDKAILEYVESVEYQNLKEKWGLEND